MDTHPPGIGANLQEVSTYGTLKMQSLSLLVIGLHILGMQRVVVVLNLVNSIHGEYCVVLLQGYCFMFYG